jgi:nucleoid-associated protein EbfC
MDLSQIMKMATQLREQLVNAQADADNVRVTGEAGAGLVRVVMNGRHEVVELHVDPKTMVPSEVGLVEDLIRAAVNSASVKVTEAQKNRVADVAKRLGIDPSMLGGGIPGL